MGVVDEQMLKKSGKGGGKVKRKIVAVIVMLSIVVVLVLPAGAAGTVYFSAVNNKLLALNNATMPTYIGSQLYLPYSFFNAGDLGVYSSGDSEKAIIYASGSKILTFNAVTGEIFDQNNFRYERYSAELHNGIVYVPVQLVCDYFGFEFGVIQAQPAAIVRVRSTSNIPDATFAAIQSIKEQMQSMYDTYMGNPNASPTPSTGGEPTYQEVIVYLSVYDFSAGKLDKILDALTSVPFKACFFVAADEIEANAGLLRRIAGNGHMIGIWLKEGSSQEYQDASALLFEAAKVKTVLVTAIGDNAKNGEDMAKAESLVFWQPTKIYDPKSKFSVSSLTDRMSTLSGTRESLYFACSDATSVVLRGFLSYLQSNNYTVRRIVETSVPILSA